MSPKGVLVDALFFENSYRCQEIMDMSTLKQILDFENNVDFFQQGVNGTIVVICTTKNLKEFTIWKGDKWESVLSRLKDYTMHIGVWVCICEKEFFEYLMFTIHKTIIDPYIEYEIGTYRPQLENSLTGVIQLLRALYFFLFICLEGMLERMLLRRP